MSLRERIVEGVQERLGVEVVDKFEFKRLREAFDEFSAFRDEASELAYFSLDYFSGRPQELRPEKRNRLSQRSRIALTQDPLAGAEANLLANFSFGKGVAEPDAEDEDVQDIIHEAWTDPVNEQKLTGFEAQRHRSNQMLAQANLYPAAFIRNGKVRLAFLNADRVVDIICDPDDSERPLWYAYDQPLKAEYDFDSDRWKMPGEGNQVGAQSAGQRSPMMGGQNIVYFPHWRNVEDVRRERAENGLPPAPEPDPRKLGLGQVEHFRINRIGETQFGTPPWARTLRFMSAMNVVTESHVAMAEAASSLIAKRTMRGTPEAVTRAANSILTMTGELGASRFGGDREERLTDPPPYGQATPPDPGSFWLENESDTLTPLALKSNAAEAQQTGQIVRAPIAAASGFGQHYLGDASNANLATATSLELPTTFTIQAWQETFRQILKWFIDVTLQAAVRAGRLGGEASDPMTDKTLAELSVREAIDTREAERRTGKKLGYKLGMPYPGRRNLPDVASTVTTVAVTFDPSGQNIPMRRSLLLWFATYGMELDDPKGWIDEVMPEEAIDAVAKAALVSQVQDAANAAQQAQQYAQSQQQAQQELSIKQQTALSKQNGPGGGTSSVAPNETPLNAPKTLEGLLDDLVVAFGDGVGEAATAALAESNGGIVV